MSNTPEHITNNNMLLENMKGVLGSVFIAFSWSLQNVNAVITLIGGVLGLLLMVLNVVEKWKNIKANNKANSDD